MSSSTEKAAIGETSCEVDGYTRTIEIRDGRRVWMCGNPRGCPTSGAAVEEPSAESPSESLAQPTIAVGDEESVTGFMSEESLNAMAADAELGALLRAAVAETDTANDSWLCVSTYHASLRLQYGHLADTDATRALSAALARSARAGALGDGQR